MDWRSAFFVLGGGGVLWFSVWVLSTASPKLEPVWHDDPREGDAPKEKLFALRDFLGFDRNVIVQASCHGTDNAALLDALTHSGDKARGVAVIGENVTGATLQQMSNAGVKGVRFNFVKRLVDFTPRDVLERIAGVPVTFGTGGGSEKSQPVERIEVKSVRIVPITS